MQILKDQNKRLVEALTCEQPFESLEGALFADLRVHLLQRGHRFCDPQQREEVGQSVFETAIEHEHFTAHLFPPFALIVLRDNVEVVLQQVDERQIRIGFAVRDGEGL